MTTEVKAKLTLDSNAEDTLSGIRDEVKSLRSDVREAQSGFTQFAGTLGAMVAHDVLRPVVESAKELALSAFELGAAADDAKQNIAGMMSGMSGKEWGEARGSATMLHEKITGISIAIGQSKEEILGAHTSLRTFLGGTEEAFDVATRNMENLTSISNVTGIGLQELGMQFGKMSAGFVSMESPVFNLLKSTKIFSSDITKINQEWQKLTGEERIKRLEGAVASVAGNLAAATPTMGDLMTSMKETGNAFMESFGGAFIKEIIDELSVLRKTVNEGGKEFEDFAEALGKDFGKEVAAIINDLIEAAEYFRENGAEISQDIREAFQFAKETIKFLVDNAGLIAGIAGAGKAASMLPSGSLMSFGKGAVGMGAEGLAGRAGGAIPGIISAIVAGGPPVWAAAAAVTALGAAAAYVAHEAGKEEQIQRDRIDELMRKERDRYKELHELDAEERRMRKRDMEELISLAHELGEETQALKRFQAVGKDKRDVLDKHVTPYTVSAANYAEMSKESSINAELLADTEMSAIADITTGLREAVKTGDSEVSGAILQALLNNQKLKDAFLKSADTMSMGADGLRLAMSALEDMNLGGGYLHNKFGEGLKKLTTPKGATVNMNGGQTFKIQQDFRDQDPDRVAIAFQEDLHRAAISRVQASTSSPFGT